MPRRETAVDEPIDDVGDGRPAEAETAMDRGHRGLAVFAKKRQEDRFGMGDIEVRFVDGLLDGVHRTVQRRERRHARCSRQRGGRASMALCHSLCIA